MNRRNGNVDRTLEIAGPRRLAAPAFISGIPLFLATFLLATALFLQAGPARSDSDTTVPLPRPAPSKSVLLINSYHQGFPWSDNIVQGVKETFTAAQENIDLWVEYMDTKRFYSEIYLEELRSLYRHKFRNRQFGAIITSDNAALQFVLRNRRTLFGQTPVVFCGVNRLTPELLTGQSNITGIAEHADFQNTILLAVRMLPRTREIVVIIPDTISANEDRKTIESLIPSFGEKLKITFWQGQSLEEAVTRAKDQETGTVILSSGVIQTQTHRVLSNREKVAKIAAAAPVPVFVVRDDDMDTGALGGRTVNGFAQGRQAAQAAINILRGTPADDIPVMTKGVNPYMFDYEAMRRFDIGFEGIPGDSIVINRPESTYRQYRTHMTAAGLIIGILAIFIALLAVNILRRKRAEEALRESEERLKAIIDNSPTGISLKDGNGRYVLVNREFRNRSWFSSDNPTGKRASDFLCPALTARLEKMDAEVRETGAVLETEIAIPSEDGAGHTVIVTKFPVFDGKGEMKWVGSISTDITDRERAAEEMRILQAELAHVSRLSTMGEMAAGFAHELNQPLAAISNFAMGCARRLQSPAPDIETISATLTKISLQAQRASDIIRRVRTFLGKKDENRIDGVLPEIDINPTIRAAADLLHGDILEFNVSLRLDLSPSLPGIQADGIQIQQIVINLARNSMEAMSEAESDPRDLVIQTAFQPDANIEIRVRDTGPGLSEDALPKLFDPFFTTKSAGMGMGLSICRSIVDHHGGKIIAANREEGGAEFRVVLPICSPDTGLLA